MQKKSFLRIYRMALIGILSAVAAVLMLLEFPISFLAPPFYEMDFSEIPIIIGAFALGPVEGVIMEALKIVLNLLFNGTITAGIGELANFLIGVSYVLPAAIFYRIRKTKKVATVGLVISTVLVVVVSAFLNAFVLIPFYAHGGSIQAFIDMGNKVNGHVTDLFSFTLLCVVPFNLLKFVTDTVVTLLVYKKVSRILKNPMER